MRDITAKELLIINIEIGRPTIEWDFGKQLLELFANHDKRLAPQTLSIWGNKAADLSEIEEPNPTGLVLVQCVSMAPCQSFTWVSAGTAN
ncbi:hypothetical protein FHS72_001070 [Loktanella ponticola]|uniref:Uncharacterized protein n=1 Tax=Yoonia ponticola TaxID=1524255 RepID=A0A7W9BJ16_9RHOB|nr:hypothetical protein [Yoonia ponticola]